MRWMKRVRKNRNGFTLVEILSVLVILAIMAAVTIPTMAGFIRDAKIKSHTSQARAVYVAAQAAAIELEGNETVMEAADVHFSSDNSSYINRVKALLATDIEEGNSYTITLNKSKVEKVEYTPVNGKKITIVGGDSVTYED